MSVQRLILWRHGQTDYNVAGRFQGHSDSALTERGRAQAEASAAALLHDQSLDAPVPLISSDLVRARDTARPLAEHLGAEVEVDAALRELSFGSWEGLTRAEVMERWPAEFASWRAGDDSGVHGGEPRAEAGRRAAQSILAHASEVPTLVVVSHGGVLRAAVAELLGLDPTRAGMIAVLDNAAWGVLDRSGPDRPWQLRAWNRTPPRG